MNEEISQEMLNKKIRENLSQIEINEQRDRFERAWETLLASLPTLLANLNEAIEITDRVNVIVESVNNSIAKLNERRCR